MPVPPPRRARRLAPGSPALIAALVVAIGLVAYNTATNLLIPGDRWYVPRNLAVGAVLLAGARAAGLSWTELGLGPQEGRWAALAVSAIVIGVSAAVALAPRVAAIRALLADRRAAEAAVGWEVLVRIPVGTAAFEEVAFRGVLLALLLDASSTPVAVGVAGAAFGLWHAGPTLAALHANAVTGRRTALVAAAVAGTAGAGVALGVLRVVSGGLLAPVAAHWAVNASGLLAARLWQATQP